jgi:hypothetical protein
VLITENKAKVVWDSHWGRFIWEQNHGEEPLDPQPPLGFTDFPEESVDPISEARGALKGYPPVTRPADDDAGEWVSGGHEKFEVTWVPGHEPHPPEEGQECPTCRRRVPKKKKPSTPTSKVHSFRLPLDQTDELEEIWEAVAKHLGVQENSYYKGEAVLRAFVIALQGPGASE